MHTGIFAATVLTFACGCAHHTVAPLEPPPTVPISERIGDEASTGRPSERWLEARDELDELVEVCAAKRAHLVDEVRHAERNERIGFAAAFGLYTLGSIAASRRGTTVVGPGPASYYPNFAYGTPAPVTGGTPTIARFGAPAPGTTGPTVALGAGGPLAERADLLTVDANHQVRLIDEEIDAAYEQLDAIRTTPEFTEADEEVFARHRARLGVLCAH